MNEKRQLLSIGEASKITGMHVKSLRYYDRIGVFVPEYIDDRSGYRYYSFEQLQNIIAVRTCLDTGIVLNTLVGYTDGDTTDYPRLLDDALGNIDRRIAELERKKVFLNFLKDEVMSNDRDEEIVENANAYGPFSLWTLPFDGDIDSFNRKDEFLRLAEEAAKAGYQISPLYFGMLMKCTGSDRKLYTIASLEDPFNIFNIEEDNEHILNLPRARYRRVTRPDLDVTEAENVFPDLFGKNYDKTVLTTVSIHSNRSEPMYSMYINLPED
jgi:DNA-binding transcriptional MerR regulator